jgi:hypothetical protein
MGPVREGRIGLARRLLLPRRTHRSGGKDSTYLHAY